MVSYLDAEAAFFPKSFSAKYQESYIGSLRGKEITSKGTLDYQFPGKFIYKNKNMIYVSNRTQSWLYKKPFIESEQGTVTINHSSQNHHLIKLFDMLNHGLEKNKDYTIKNEGQKVSFIFSAENKKLLGLDRTILYTKKDMLTRFSDVFKIETFDRTDKKKTLEFLDYNEDIKFKKEHFVFTIPPNTKRIDKR